MGVHTATTTQVCNSSPARLPLYPFPLYPRDGGQQRFQVQWVVVIVEGKGYNELPETFSPASSLGIGQISVALHLNPHFIPYRLSRNDNSVVLLKSILNILNCVYMYVGLMCAMCMGVGHSAGMEGRGHPRVLALGFHLF